MDCLVESVRGEEGPHNPEAIPRMEPPDVEESHRVPVLVPDGIEHQAGHARDVHRDIADEVAHAPRAFSAYLSISRSLHSISPSGVARLLGMTSSVFL